MDERAPTHPLIMSFMNAHQEVDAVLGKLAMRLGKEERQFIELCQQKHRSLADLLHGIPSSTDAKSSYKVVTVLSHPLQVVAQCLYDIIMHTECANESGMASALLEAISIVDHIQWSVSSVAHLVFRQTKMFNDASLDIKNLLDSLSFSEKSIRIAKLVLLKFKSETNEYIALTVLGNVSIKEGSRKKITKYIPEYEIISNLGGISELVTH